jgi:hypothetical protein
MIAEYQFRDLFVHTIYKYSVDKSSEALWNDSGTILLSSWH